MLKLLFADAYWQSISNEMVCGAVNFGIDIFLLNFRSANGRMGREWLALMQGNLSYCENRICLLILFLLA